MRINVHGKNKFEVKPGLREYINEKVGELEKMFSAHQDVSANVVCKEYGTDKVIEITIPTKHLILRAETMSNDMFQSVDLAVDKIEKQLLKHKKKINSIIRNREGVANYFSNMVNEAADVEETKKVVKSKEVDLEVMSVDEAMLQAELLGHDFYMFINQDDHKVSIIYLRDDGDYGIMRAK
ncbi:MAG: ribosome-associated translation inhibitor RaiA [Bacilli bacterium]|nr:ribosome-associated translation inhibitor RaiA [Bacilli bacterium]